jgi:hypothetical protein
VPNSEEIPRGRKLNFRITEPSTCRAPLLKRCLATRNVGLIKMSPHAATRRTSSSSFHTVWWPTKKPVAGGAKRKRTLSQKRKTHRLVNHQHPREHQRTEHCVRVSYGPLAVPPRRRDEGAISRGFQESQLASASKAHASKASSNGCDA